MPQPVSRWKWLFAVLLLVANMAMVGLTRLEAEAPGPCWIKGNCHCFDDGSGPHCSHVMGGDEGCRGPGTC